LADSSPTWIGRAETCAPIEVDQAWAPGELVAEYVRRDGAGELVGPAPWLDSALACAGQRPLGSVATIVRGVEVARADSQAGGVRYVLRYSVAGVQIGAHQFRPGDRVEEIAMSLVHTPWGWRISGSRARARVLPLAAIASLHPSTGDSAAIVRVASAAPGEPGPMPRLLRGDEDWDHRFPATEWLGAFNDAEGKANIRRVKPKLRMTHEGCREADVAVVAFDPEGAAFAWRAETGGTEGPVEVMTSGHHYVRPGDSLVLPRPVTGRFLLRATGREEIVPANRVIHDYVLTLTEEVDGQRRTLRVWEGTFSEVAPAVKWVGDLNGDAVPDVLIQIPRAGYSTTLRLLFSADSPDGPMLTAVGESAITDC